MERNRGKKHFSHHFLHERRQARKGQSIRIKLTTNPKCITTKALVFQQIASFAHHQSCNLSITKKLARGNFLPKLFTFSSIVSALLPHFSFLVFFYLLFLHCFKRSQRGGKQCKKYACFSRARYERQQRHSTEQTRNILRC